MPSSEDNSSIESPSVHAQYPEAALLEVQSVAAGVATDIEHSAMRVPFQGFALLLRPKGRLGEIHRRAARDREETVGALDDLERVRAVVVIPDGMAERVLLVRRLRHRDG